MALSAKRVGGFSEGPISSIEIVTWAKRYRIRIGPWENWVLDELDKNYLHISAEKIASKNKGPTIQQAAEDREDLKRAKVASAERRKQRKALKGG